MAYRLGIFLSLLGDNRIIHVSIIKTFYKDGDYIIHWDSVQLDENLSYEEKHVAMLDRDFFKAEDQRNCDCEALVKNNLIEDAT